MNYWKWRLYRLMESLPFIRLMNFWKCEKHSNDFTMSNRGYYYDSVQIGNIIYYYRQCDECGTVFDFYWGEIPKRENMVETMRKALDNVKVEIGYNTYQGSYDASSAPFIPASSVGTICHACAKERGSIKFPEGVLEGRSCLVCGNYLGELVREQ